LAEFLRPAEQRGSFPDNAEWSVTAVPARTDATLLMVLDRPQIPLHTNGSENDIRCQVTKRKISGGTRSDAGRDCRDPFLALANTCSKLRISFWDYLGARLAIPGNPAVPLLPDLVGQTVRSP